MSKTGVRERVRKQGWAAPGGAHDFLVRFLKIALPIGIGVLLAYLAIAPLSKRQDISFILDKNKVDVAKERMRVRSARYQGEDDVGRPFTLDAASAVQARREVPIVDVMGMSAQLLLDSGPATLKADTARYDMEQEKVDVTGPVVFARSDGYRLETRDVAVDMNKRSLSSRGRVEGTMPLGRFSADKIDASLANREVRLTGRARLHIVQGGLR